MAHDGVREDLSPESLVGQSLLCSCSSGLATLTSVDLSEADLDGVFYYEDRDGVTVCDADDFAGEGFGFGC